LIISGSTILNGFTVAIEEKQKELNKYRAILLATLDYSIEKFSRHKIAEPLIPHYEQLKKKTEEYFYRGRLNTLKQWLRDMTDEPRETEDQQFNAYITSKTGYDYDVFDSFEKSLKRILKRKQIKTDNEYRDVMSAIDQLCESIPSDHSKIDIFNALIRDYELNKRNLKSS
jgi:hypothetical protein